MKRSILLVFAHPDDESFGVAGTVARYTQQGVPVELICATRGEKGTRLDVPDNTDTGTAREAELRTAAAVMGIRRIHFLGYIDGELETANDDEVAGKVLSIMQEFQPEVVITFGSDGITGHPDHIAIGKAATRAFEMLVRKDSSLRKLYYVTTDTSEIGGATRPDEQVTTAIDISDYLDIKIRAVAAHRSQHDARDFVEMLEQNKTLSSSAREFFYLANPMNSTKETALLQ